MLQLNFHFYTEETMTSSVVLTLNDIGTLEPRPLAKFALETF